MDDSWYNGLGNPWVCEWSQHHWWVDSHLRRPGRHRFVGSAPVQPNVSSEAFSGHFGVFVEPQSDPTKRSSKILLGSTEGLGADWAAARNPVASHLVEALACRERTREPPIPCVCASQT